MGLQVLRLEVGQVLGGAVIGQGPDFALRGLGVCLKVFRGGGEGERPLCGVEEAVQPFEGLNDCNAM